MLHALLGLIGRGQDFVRRRTVAAELRSELEAHYQMLIEEMLAAGLPAEAAARQARLALGNFRSLEESCHEQAGFPFLEALIRDLRYACRSLRKAPLATVVAALSLAVAIAAGTIGFCIADALLIRPRMVNHLSNVVALLQPDNISPGEWNNANHGYYGITDETFAKWTRRAAPLFRSLGGVRLHFATLSLSGRPQQVQFFEVTPNFFSTFRVTPVIGAAFSSADAQPEARPAVISYSLWKREFAGKRDAPGRHLVLLGKDYVVTGVMPEGFTTPSKGDVWVPFTAAGESPRNRNVLCFGVLHEGISRQAAEKAMGAGAGQLAIVPGTTAFAGTGDEIAWMLLLGSVLMLLAGCATVATAQWARAGARRREIALRLSIGASRFGVVRQRFLESALLAASGGAVGLLIAMPAAALLKRVYFEEILRLLGSGTTIVIGSRMVVFAAAAALACAVISAIPAALQCARTRAVVAAGASPDTGRTRLFASLIAVQVVIALMLMAIAGQLTSGIFVRHARMLRRVHAERFTSFEVLTPAACDWNCRRQVEDQLLRTFQRLPGVEAASLTSHPPIDPRLAPGSALEIEDRSPSASDFAYLASVSPEYFSMVPQPVVAGRVFTSADTAGAPPVAVVNQAFAERYWPKQEAVGRRVRLARWPEWVTVVGVVADLRSSMYSKKAEFTLYRPAAQQGAGLSYVLVRSENDPQTIDQEAIRALRSSQLAHAIGAPRPLQETTQHALLTERMLGWIFLGLSLHAILLAAASVYSLLAYISSQRSKEIALRIALGAPPRRVTGNFARRAVPPLAAGLACGTPLAWLMARWLERTDAMVPFTPWVLAGAPLVVAVVAMIATWFPARRAAAGDPMPVLRHD